jgi:3D (Asp-Asp-Asp) domain-containing protein
MRATDNTNSSLKKITHIGAVALIMGISLGVAAVVSGKPAQASVAHLNSVPQSTPQLQAVVAAPVVITAPVIAKPAVVQAELLHDAPTVELVQPKVQETPHRHIVKMMVTAYCPCTKCCGENASGITASGKLVTDNNGQFVAADPSLSFGTKLIIPGYASGAVEVLDRGGAIRGNHIDVFFPTHEEALKWGRKMLDVVVVD